MSDVQVTVTPSAQQLKIEMKEMLRGGKYTLGGFAYDNGYFIQVYYTKPELVPSSLNSAAGGSRKSRGRNKKRQTKKRR
jgi:hypothetical protein